MPQENKTAQEQQTKKPANDKKQGGNKKPTQQNNNKPKKSNAILEYKGKPLVRSGNTIYYGDINDAYVVCINIKNSSKLKDIKLAEDVTIQLLSTDDSLSPKDKIIKKSEKKGLFNALDLG